jgi:hypothetical protein
MSNEKKAMSVIVRLLVISLLLCGLCWNVTAQQRGSQPGGGAVEIVDARGDVVGRFTEAHALVIGESEYINTGAWRRLPGVKEDVAAVKNLLTEQGFNVETIENANSSRLKSGITDFLHKYGFNPNARIIVYFAGHGATLDIDGRKTGYIVPVDAPPASNNSNFLQAVIPMTDFEAWAKHYTSRHILFMFDSCFAGSVFRSQTTTPPAISRLLNQPVRQFITSGGANEEVDDDSKFRKEFENALRNGFADSNKDGYVTGTELGLYLYNQVSNYTNGVQNPRVEKLKDINLNKGDFIFFVNASQIGSSPAVVKIQDSQPLQNTNITPEKETKEFFIGTWSGSPEYGGSYDTDTYELNLLANGRCTVKMSNDNAEQNSETGNWSYDTKTNTFKVNAVFRNAKISYMRAINWTSLVRFADDNNSFYILEKPAANAQSNARFTFFRE